MSEKKNGPFTVLSSKEIYKNPWISVREDQIIHPSGQPGIYGVVTSNYGANAVILDDQMNIYLGKQYRYPIEQDSIELPGGDIDPSETPLEAAQREILEEVGVTAKNWHSLNAICPATCTHHTKDYTFLATDITLGKQQLDDDEDVSLVVMPFEDAVQMVLRGDIFHASTVAGILKAKYYLDQK